MLRKDTFIRLWSVSPDAVLWVALSYLIPLIGICILGINQTNNIDLFNSILAANACFLIGVLIHLYENVKKRTCFGVFLVCFVLNFAFFIYSLSGMKSAQLISPNAMYIGLIVISIIVSLAGSYIVKIDEKDTYREVDILNQIKIKVYLENNVCLKKSVEFLGNTLNLVMPGIGINVYFLRRKIKDEKEILEQDQHVYSENYRINRLNFRDVRPWEENELAISQAFTLRKTVLQDWNLLKEKEYSKRIAGSIDRELKWVIAAPIYSNIGDECAITGVICMNSVISIIDDDIEKQHIIHKILEDFCATIDSRIDIDAGVWSKFVELDKKSNFGQP